MLAVVVIALLAVTALLQGLVPPTDDVTPTRPEQQLHISEATTLALQPVGDIDPLLVTRHAELIERRFGRPVRVLEPVALPVGALSTARQQVDASVLLDSLYIHKPPEVTHLVGVTDEDLFATDWDYLYGFSQVVGRVAVYSTARLGARGSRLSGLATDRAEKVIVHELGHTFGLDHCDTEHCSMSTVESAQSLERMSRFYCARCAHRVESWSAPPAVAREEIDDPVIARGDGLYGRGAFDRAWFRYATALMQRPTSAARLNRLGVASAELGMANVAHLSYRLSIAREPDYPLPYYNFALLYAAVDPSRSSALLQAGFERDPDRVEALGYLGSVYAEVLGDEYRALHYFERYVREGGNNPSMLYRYRKLLTPAIFEFDDREVGVFEARRGPAPSFDETLVWNLMRVQWLLGLERWFVPLDAGDEGDTLLSER